MSLDIFQGTGKPHDWDLPKSPPWREFKGEPLVELPQDPVWGEHHPNELKRAQSYRVQGHEVELVNIAIMLRRPLLITGRPGTGKSTLAYAIAHELGLEPVLRWSITSRTTLQDGLYRYDAIARLQDANMGGDTPSADIGRYLQLGPLGTALLPYGRPRLLLIDEIDKSDIDLPNDLLNVFEEGEFRIPELVRLSDGATKTEVGVEQSTNRVPIRNGVVRCRAFPIVLMTSNGERDFPPAFLRRCVRLELAEPDQDRLEQIIRAHLGDDALADSSELITNFLQRRSVGELATDQLLNAIFVTLNRDVSGADKPSDLADKLLRHLSTAD